MASNELKLLQYRCFLILAMYRMRAGGAIDPIATYESANYRKIWNQQDLQQIQIHQVSYKN